MYIFLLHVIYICNLCKYASQSVLEASTAPLGTKLATGPRGRWPAYVTSRGLGQNYTFNTLTPKLYTTPQFYVKNWGLVKGVYMWGNYFYHKPPCVVVVNIQGCFTHRRTKITGVL